MTTYDTITYGGTEKSFVSAGIDYDNCRLTRYNMREDVFMARFPQVNIVDEPVYPFESVVTVRTGRTSTTGADNSFSGGVIKFTGKRIGLQAEADGQGNGVTYEFKGPWYDLANTHYLQTYKGAAVNPYHPGEIVLNTSTQTTIPGAFLFISIGDQMQAILQWILDQYAAQGMTAPFQYTGRQLNSGAIDLTTSGTAAVGAATDKNGNAYTHAVVSTPSIDGALYAQFLVSYIAKPMMCSQALQKMIELSPRTNICFDYSTAIPTIQIGSIDNFVPVSIELFDDEEHKAISIKRRDDLVARAVILTYRITNTIDGQQQIDFAVDKYGVHGVNSDSDPNAGLRVFSETLDLQGYSVTSTTAQIDCETLACRGGTNATKRKWWANRRGGERAEFIDSRIRFQTQAFVETIIPDATLTYASTDAANGRTAGQPLSVGDLAFFTNRIVRGTHHTWMRIGGVEVQSLKVRISSKMEYAKYNVVSTGDTAGSLPLVESTSNAAVNGQRTGKVNTEEIHCEIEITNAHNAVDGSPFTASTTATTTAAELFLTGENGIAKYLFNSLAALQYDGELVKVETDFANNVNLTNAINFTNGRAEWATMNAQPQSIVEDFGSKETSIMIGVSNDLTAGQMSSLLNMWAFRRPWYNPAVRADNTVTSGGQVTMPQTAGGANATKGVTDHNDFVTTDYATTGDPTSTVNGQVKLTAEKITSILAATTPTPFGSFTSEDIKRMEPREVLLCDESGDVVNAIVLMSGFYTKP